MPALGLGCRASACHYLLVLQPVLLQLVLLPVLLLLVVLYS